MESKLNAVIPKGGRLVLDALAAFAAEKEQAGTVWAPAAQSHLRASVACVCARPRVSAHQAAAPDTSQAAAAPEIRLGALQPEREDCGQPCERAPSGNREAAQCLLHGRAPEAQSTEGLCRVPELPTEELLYATLCGGALAPSLHPSQDGLALLQRVSPSEEFTQPTYVHRLVRSLELSEHVLECRGGHGLPRAAGHSSPRSALRGGDSVRRSSLRIDGLQSFAEAAQVEERLEDTMCCAVQGLILTEADVAGLGPGVVLRGEPGPHAGAPGALQAHGRPEVQRASLIQPAALRVQAVPPQQVVPTLQLGASAEVARVHAHSGARELQAMHHRDAVGHLRKGPVRGRCLPREGLHVS
mmetsp:Transcript_67569/g.218194  ORF Transcript_67569/g.218194 Transcript_67569/m.218194 type:complete len:357 (-) Transcript_67569:676-1746(-)